MLFIRYNNVKTPSEFNNVHELLKNNKSYYLNKNNINSNKNNNNSNYKFQFTNGVSNFYSNIPNSSHLKHSSISKFILINYEYYNIDINNKVDFNQSFKRSICQNKINQINSDNNKIINKEIIQNSSKRILDIDNIQSKNILQNNIIINNAKINNINSNFLNTQYNNNNTNENSFVSFLETFKEKKFTNELYKRLSSIGRGIGENQAKDIFILIDKSYNKLTKEELLFEINKKLNPTLYKSIIKLLLLAFNSSNYKFKN